MNQSKKPAETSAPASGAKPADTDIPQEGSKRAAEQPNVEHKSENDAAENQHSGAMPQKLQAHIGRHLQAMFDEVAQEPIPERLLNLLQELERKEKNG